MKKLLKPASLILVLVLLVSALPLSGEAAELYPANGAFVFDNEAMLYFITRTHNVDVSFDPSETALRVSVNSTDADPDPYLLLDLSLLEQTLQADEFPYLLVTYRCPAANSAKATNTELFLSAGSVTGPTAGCSVNYSLVRGNTYGAARVDLAACSWWHGDIHSIRIDPFMSASYGDTLYIDSVILCRSSADYVAAYNARKAVAGTPSVDNTADDICNSYQVKKYTAPMWEGDIVYNEAVYPIEDKNGNCVYTLMYTPDEVKTVYDATFSHLYREGVDYSVEGNRLTILPGSAISTMRYNYIHPQSNPNNYGWDRYYNRTAAGDGKWEYWGQSPEFFAGYLNITYTHSDSWTHWVPENKADELPITSRKIQNNESMNVVFFGDSITGGANASSYRNVYPYAEWWNEQIISSLRANYGCTNINAYYSSVGGSTATDMLPELQDSVIRYKPDLVFIEYGINDCMNESQSGNPSGSRVSSQFGSAIEQMIVRVRQQYPNCEFVLVAPFYANPYCHFTSFIDACRDRLTELERRYSGVVCADVTRMQASLMEFKDYLDFSGDNMCHPNDFMSRIFSQVCLETIVPGGIDAYVPEERTGVSVMNATQAAPGGHGWYWSEEVAYGYIGNYGSNGQDIRFSVDLCLLSGSEDPIAAFWTSADGQTAIDITSKTVSINGSRVGYNWGETSFENWHRVDIEIKNGAASVTIDGALVHSVGSGVRALTSYQLFFSQRGSMAIDNLKMTTTNGNTVYIDCDFENQSAAERLLGDGLGEWVPLNVSTVRYDLNGGQSGPAYSQVKFYSRPLLLTTEIPVREGYTFLGWSTSASGDAQYAAGDYYVKDGGVTLYAVWEADTAPTLPGDVNNDGSVTSADISMLRMYLTGDCEDANIVLANCDFNGDGSITAADITALRSFLSGEAARD